MKPFKLPAANDSGSLDSHPADTVLAQLLVNFSGREVASPDEFESEVREFVTKRGGQFLIGANVRGDTGLYRVAISHFTPTGHDQAFIYGLLKKGETIPGFYREHDEFVQQWHDLNVDGPLRLVKDTLVEHGLGAQTGAYGLAN